MAWLLKGTGGVRKVRFGMDGRGKSGGLRVLYLFHGFLAPTFLLTAFAKNEEADLSQAEIKALARLARSLKQQYRR